MSEKYDILIAGSGFAGSLTALALHGKGFKICLVEKGQHPRFAIGESSTPIADMILRAFAKEYNLPWLADFSRYGSWQKTHPEVVCGLKRGFSYYKHHIGGRFSTDDQHSNELLVAASVNDEQSDTNWLRADIDAFLVEKVQESGIKYFDLTDIVNVTRQGDGHIFETVNAGGPLRLSASFFIDATGGGTLAERLFSVHSSSESFLTNSFGVFTHLENLPPWSGILKEKGISAEDYPYDPDHSALHHVLDEGWVWALRFNNNRTSWGFALNGWDESISGMPKEALWERMLHQYPDIADMLGKATLSDQPGSIIRSGRLQRKLDQCYGEGWVALPHTAGFIDPLFSTGIAYSLAGVEQVCSLVIDHFQDRSQLNVGLKRYEEAVFQELKLIDKLVDGCYKAMPHFPLFVGWSMLYFAFTVTYEQRRLKGFKNDHFLCADQELVRRITDETYEGLSLLAGKTSVSQKEADAFINLVRQRIAPFNTIGLLSPEARNMYRHTAAVF